MPHSRLLHKLRRRRTSSQLQSKFRQVQNGVLLARKELFLWRDSGPSGQRLHSMGQLYTVELWLEAHQKILVDSKMRSRKHPGKRPHVVAVCCCSLECDRCQDLLTLGEIHILAMLFFEACSLSFNLHSAPSLVMIAPFNSIQPVSKYPPLSRSRSPVPV